MRIAFFVTLLLCACGGTPASATCDSRISCGSHGACAIALSKPACVCDDGNKADGLSCVVLAATDAGIVGPPDSGTIHTVAGTVTRPDAGTMVELISKGRAAEPRVGRSRCDRRHVALPSSAPIASAP